jgi:glutamyl-tRNA reductase
MEPTLMVIGLNPHSAPAEVRERFCIGEAQQSEALSKLARAEGITEVMVLSHGGRTDFVLWACDASAASGSVLGFLTREHGLQLTDWKHFYRKLDQAALAHVFLAAAGVECLAHVQLNREHFKEASVTALQAGTLGRFLDAVAQRALAFARELHDDATRNGLESAEEMARVEAKTFYARLMQERMAPTIAALRERLDDICLKELDSFYEGLSSLSEQEREMVEAFATRLTQRIAGTLAHELKEPCEKSEQERLSAAVQRLFHLHPAEQSPESSLRSPVGSHR